MSEKEPKKHAAVLKIYPSNEAIQWLESEHGDGWRVLAAEKIRGALECLARGGAWVYLGSEQLSGLSETERDSVIEAAEFAAEETADTIRAGKRLAILASEYSLDELRKALEVASGGPKLDPALSAERRKAAEGLASKLRHDPDGPCEVCGGIHGDGDECFAPDEPGSKEWAAEHAETGESAPVPPKKGAP